MSGGGAGRRYFPKANAAIAIMAIKIRDFVGLAPSLDVQSIQRAPASRARQLLRDNLAPQFAQKFERLIVGVFGKAGGLYLECAGKAKRRRSFGCPGQEEAFYPKRCLPINRD